MTEERRPIGAIKDIRELRKRAVANLRAAQGILQETWFAVAHMKTMTTSSSVKRNIEKECDRIDRAIDILFDAQRRVPGRKQ